MNIEYYDKLVVSSLNGIGKSFTFTFTLILCILISSTTTVASESQKWIASIASHGVVDYAKSLSQIYVDGNATVSNALGSVFLVGCTVRGQAYNPPRDGLFDDWWTYRNVDAQTIKSYGFNTIRLLAYWEQIETSQKPYEFTYDGEYIERIRQTVESYNQQGIYVILTLYGYGGLNTLARFIPTLGNDCNFANDFFSNSSSTSAREHLKWLWLRLSETFKNSPGVAGYDVCNEPRSTDGALSNQQIADYWFDMVDYVTDALRLNGDNHVIFVNFSPWVSSAAFMTRKLEDNNMVYSPHWYRGIDTSDFNVTYNDYSLLAREFEDPSKKMLEFNVPFIMEEQGFGNMPIYEGDSRDVWLRNAVTIHKTSPLMQGWLYFCYIEYGGAVDKNGWEDRLIILANLSIP